MIDFKGSRFIILVGLKLDRCLRCATATHTFERFWVHRFCASKFIDFPVKSTHQVFRQRLVYPSTLANSSPAPQYMFFSTNTCRPPCKVLGEINREHMWNVNETNQHSLNTDICPNTIVSVRTFVRQQTCWTMSKDNKNLTNQNNKQKQQ